MSESFYILAVNVLSALVSVWLGTHVHIIGCGTGSG